MKKLMEGISREGRNRWNEEIWKWEIAVFVQTERRRMAKFPMSLSYQEFILAPAGGILSPPANRTLEGC